MPDASGSAQSPGQGVLVVLRSVEGFTSCSTSFGSGVSRGWQCSRLNDRFLSPLALGLTAAVAGQMGHMLIDVFNSRPQVQLLWLVAGLVTAMRNLASEA